MARMVRAYGRLERRVQSMEITIDRLKQSCEWREASMKQCHDPYIVRHRCPIGIPADNKGYEGFVSFQWPYGEEGSYRLADEHERFLIDWMTATLEQRFRDNEAGIFLSTMERDGLVQWVIVATDLLKASMEAIDATSETSGIEKYFGDRPPCFIAERFVDPSWNLLKNMQSVFQLQAA
jgi:hypothetical protein